MGSNTDHKSGKVELVGAAGRIVVAEKDVSAYKARGYVVVESTNLPLTRGIAIPNARKTLEDKPEPPKEEEMKMTKEMKKKLIKVIKNLRSEEDLAIFVKDNKLEIEFDDKAKLKSKKEFLLESLGLLD